MKKLSIGSWAFLSDQEQPTNDFHALVRELSISAIRGSSSALRRIRPGKP